MLTPIRCNGELLNQVVIDTLHFSGGPEINSIQDISRSDASAINLSQTSDAISEIIQFSKQNSVKSICFVTGAPGAGKTLVGLNIATKHIDKDNDLHSVFLSDNGPLVTILGEALTRDKVEREKERGRKAVFYDPIFEYLQEIGFQGILA